MKPQRSKKKLAKALAPILVLPLLILSWLILTPSSLSTTLGVNNSTFSSGQSANYRITADIIVEGGEPGRSGNYRISDVIGSAVEGGESSSNNFRLLSGPIPGLYPGEPFSNTIIAPSTGVVTVTQSISVTGETIADASVVIHVGEDEYTTTADHNGDYVVPNVALTLGYNMIESQGTNAYGNRTTASVAVTRTTYFLTGTLLSRVHDAGQLVTWTTITWQVDTPAGTSLVFRTRTGDTPTPDETWSDWSEEYTTPGQAISSPPGRYIQYEAIFSTTGGQMRPALEDVTISYEVTAIACPDFQDPPGVGLEDVQFVDSQWRWDAVGQPYDCDRDGVITVVDIICVVKELGNPCSSVTSLTSSSPTPVAATR